MNNKITFYTLGCRLNQAESDMYQEELEQYGFRVVSCKQAYNIAVINTCAVTHKADREGRRAIRQLKKKCPQAIIIMTGCSDFKMSEIDYYIKDKENFVKEFLKKIQCSPSTRVSGERGLGGEDRQGSRTRVNIKIQTGCDNHCTYCFTTISRGKSRSFPAEMIIKEIKEKVKQGYKEVVLTGVNIGQYQVLNQNFKALGLTELIKNILKETKIKRIRLSSINPEYVYDNKEFLKLFNNKRLCRHLHLSLQSGSDKILKKMNRHYNTKQYLAITKKYYKAYPDFGFTTDVIVGFPGESDKDFLHSLQTIKKCAFLKIHVFRYSQRPNTAAAIMKDQVDEKIKKQRAKIMQELNTEIEENFFNNIIRGHKQEVLFENKKNGYYFGHASNYCMVKYKSKRNLKNQIFNLIIH